MSPIDLTYSNFEKMIGSGDHFSTNERDNNLTELITKWNEYLKGDVHSGKRLSIALLSVKIIGNTNLTLRNIDLGEIRLQPPDPPSDRLEFIPLQPPEPAEIPPDHRKYYLYFYSSTVRELRFSDTDNGVKEKVIQGDGLSSIKSLKFDNIHFRNDGSDSLIIYNLNIGYLCFARTINLSEKIQIFGCNIDDFLISGSDIGKMLFIENNIKNLYITGSAVFRMVLLGNTIQKLQRHFKDIPGFSNKNFKLPYSEMASISRQLKSAFDESKSFLSGDRFYADEMFYTLMNPKGSLLSKPLLFLHLISSRFGTSWILAANFILALGLTKLLLAKGTFCVGFKDLTSGIINNINPYTNFQEVKGSMEPMQFIYLILLSYGIYQFVLSVRRISKR